MIRLDIYLLVIALLLFLVAASTTFLETQGKPAKDQFSHFGNLYMNLAMSSAAYWALLFVLGLIVSGALWFILLLLIWVPSEWVKNFFDSNMLGEVMQSIGPIVNRSDNTPGITGIPLMDYVSIYCAFLFAPLTGVWSIVVKDKTNRNTPYKKPENESTLEKNEVTEQNA